MRCPNCQTENESIAKFCIACAAPLSVRCPQCRQENPFQARFCSNCGASVRTAVEKPSQPPADGERRHLTVLFCDLVSSTEIAARLDPEDWHAIAADYQRTAASAVTTLGGHVAKYLGDGLVVYFGYPEAQEDAVERGVRARSLNP